MGPGMSCEGPAHLAGGKSVASLGRDWDEINWREFPWGEDCAYLELDADLHVPDNQPKILWVNEAVTLKDLLEDAGDLNVEVAVQGMSDFVSHGERAPGGDISVHWEEVELRECTYTATTQARAADLAVSLGNALTSCRRRGTRGNLRLEDFWCPKGFSGGGTYVKVPARGVNLDAHPDAPGKY